MLRLRTRPHSMAAVPPLFSLAIPEGILNIHRVSIPINLSRFIKEAQNSGANQRTLGPEGKDLLSKNRQIFTICPTLIGERFVLPLCGDTESCLAIEARLDEWLCLFKYPVSGQTDGLFLSLRPTK